jgi:hypothetical protein
MFKATSKTSHLDTKENEQRRNIGVLPHSTSLRVRMTAAKIAEISRVVEQVLGMGRCGARAFR